MTPGKAVVAGMLKTSVPPASEGIGTGIDRLPLLGVSVAIGLGSESVLLQIDDDMRQGLGSGRVLQALHEPRRCQAQQRWVLHMGRLH